MTDINASLELRSTVTAAGRLDLALIETPVADPGSDEVVIRIEATPINPSDLGLMFGAADVDSFVAGGDGKRPTLSAAMPDWAMPGVQSRLDRAMPVGVEGAGTVVHAGAGTQHLLGKRVAAWGGGMYAQYRTVPARDVAVLPDGATAADGASMFVNPLTALGFVETMKAQGHRAIVHTAAASNLGQMLNRICLADGIALINIVRRPEQAAILRDLGAPIVLDSSRPDFESMLADAVAETGATLAFDAIGGGTQAARILAAMEAVAARSLPAFSRYGSDTFKQVYIYGALDPSPTVLDRWIGFSWSVGGWLLTDFLKRIDQDRFSRLRQRVIDELATTFASTYTNTITLAQALDPDVARDYLRKATGQKYLINPAG